MMILGSTPSHEIIYQLETKLTQVRIENWINQDIFSYQWWILLGTLFTPWLLWWKWVDKTRLTEITLYGAITLILASFLDAILSELVLWEYNYYLIPLWPRLISADFALLPVTYMFIYQYFREWKKFLLGIFVVSALYSFVGEPLLIWLDIYELHGWKHIYSFPIYIVMAVFVKWLVQRIIAHGKNTEVHSLD